jgi:hypothetical protein
MLSTVFMLLWNIRPLKQLKFLQKVGTTFMLFKNKNTNMLFIFSTPWIDI